MIRIYDTERKMTTGFMDAAYGSQVWSFAAGAPPGGEVQWYDWTTALPGRDPMVRKGEIVKVEIAGDCVWLSVREIPQGMTL